MQFQFKTWHCPICKHSREIKLGIRGGPTHRYGLGVETQVVQCTSCKLIYPNPFPIPISPNLIYEDTDQYFIHHNASDKIEYAAKELQFACAKLNKKTLTLLDVGAGRGEFLYAAKHHGHNTTGLELADTMIAAAKMNYNLDLCQETIEAHATTHSEKYDLITMNSVLEHVYDPDSMIQAAAKLLHPRGLLYIELPNEPNLLTSIGNFLNRLMGSDAIYNISPSWPPFHVYGFNLHALRILLGKYNLEIIASKISTGHIMTSDGSMKDRLKSFLANRINDIANLTGTASNMNVWVKRKS